MVSILHDDIVIAMIVRFCVICL